MRQAGMCPPPTLAFRSCGRRDLAVCELLLTPDFADICTLRWAVAAIDVEQLHPLSAAPVSISHYGPIVRASVDSRLQLRMHRTGSTGGCDAAAGEVP